MKGIRTITDLKDRCRVDDITGCWHWHGGSSRGLPSTWLPAAQRVVTLGVVVCWLETGNLPLRGVVWHHVCETRFCANPKHRRSGTKSTSMAAHSSDGISTLRRSRITMARRAQSAITEEVVSEIRNSSETLRVLATRHSIHVSTVSKIRRGQMRAPLLRGASVFSLGGSAA